MTGWPSMNDLARVRPDDAREDLDQGRFTGAVLAEEGMDAAASQANCTPSRARTPP